MDKRRMWHDFIPDVLFSMPPSFWAFIAGAFVSIGVNLLTGIALMATHSVSKGVWTGSVLFFLSAGAFAGVSLVVEDCRARVKPANVKHLIHDRKQRLCFLFLLGALSFILGIVFIWH